MGTAPGSGTDGIEDDVAQCVGGCCHQAGKEGVNWSEIWSGGEVMWGKAGKLNPVVPQHQENGVLWFHSAREIKSQGSLGPSGPGELEPWPCQICTYSFWVMVWGKEAAVLSPLPAAQLETTWTVSCLERCVVCSGCHRWGSCHGAMLSPAQRSDGSPGTRARECRGWHRLYRAAVPVAQGLLPALGLMLLLILL